jgi:hypothetical protein
MNRIIPISRTADTVTLSRADYQTLIEWAEEAQDRAAIGRALRSERKLGKAKARADHLPIERVECLLAGESPVRVWRLHRGLGARALAARAGVSAAYLSEIETGKKPGSLAAMARLAQALGRPLEDFVTD